ncbi:MAG: hypothetical protein N2319_10050 [Candidatus Kapabacteria bacterium]|nr:hypothetical protein [Candidatus Kapabacteria bacterium]
MRIAGVDIGTNTILMAIADYDGNLKIIRDEHSLARLGQDLNRTGIISEEALIRAVKILDKYRTICDDLNVDIIKAVGTSALRDAINSNEVVTILSNALNSDIEVISGSKEAQLSFLGTIEDNQESIVIDIGGGSTEITYGKSDNIFNHISLQIGAVRITEEFLQPHPPLTSSIHKAIDRINSILDSIDFRNNECKFYAVAGTPTTLASISLGLKDFEREKVHLYRLTKNKIDELVDLLFRTEIKDIINKFGVNPMRADVISAGGLILKLIMEKFGTDSVIVSANGLRIGIIKSIIKNIN